MKCGGDGTCCGSIMGCGDCDAPRSSGWWLVIAVFLIIAIIAFGHHAHAEGNCTRMKATDTLILHGHRQHAEHFVECIVGRWPNVYSEFHHVL